VTSEQQFQVGVAGSLVASKPEKFKADAKSRGGRETRHEDLSFRICDMSYLVLKISSFSSCPN